MVGKETEVAKKLAGQVARLSELISYQVDSVVSRTIIDRKVGTITLFAFDSGQELSEHTAPYDAFVFILDGEIEISLSGKPIRLKEGEMTIMPANKPHALSALSKLKMLLVMVKS